MKKIIYLIALVAISLSANAKVLRVSNVEGSSAPYSSYIMAELDAVDGDTIMLEGSSTPYCADGDTLKITKRVTIKGPGYFLVENGISNENGATANFNMILSCVDGVTISGVVANEIRIIADNNIITRNHVTYITFGSGTTQNIVHQNFLKAAVGHYSSYADEPYPSYTQITNNIFFLQYAGSTFMFLDYATIKNNTFTNSVNTRILSNCTFENNIVAGSNFGSNEDGNTTLNNMEVDQYKTYQGALTDKDIWATDSTMNEGIYGAFAGDDPYVISGIPAGPFIEDVEVPASVAKGKELNVTVKIGVSK